MYRANADRKHNSQFFISLHLMLVSPSFHPDYQYSETYRIVYKDRHSSTKDLFQKAIALTFSKWISYLDFLLGKNIKDFMKPVYLAGNIRMVQLTDQMERMNTKSMANERIQNNAFNTSSYTPDETLTRSTHQLKDNICHLLLRHIQSSQVLMVGSLLRFLILNHIPVSNIFH